MWSFVIGCILWTLQHNVSAYDRSGISLSTNAPSRLVHAYNFEVWCGNEFRKWILTLDSSSEVVKGGEAFSRLR